MDVPRVAYTGLSLDPNGANVPVWRRTSNGGKLDLTFVDLPPGSYTLAVRVFTAAGDGLPAFQSFTIVGLPSPEAEANCRNDHRNDVEATFAWAFSGTSPTAVSEPTPAPASPSGGSPPTAPRSIDVRMDRNVVAVDILPPRDGGGLPMQGYRWTLTGPESRSGVEPSEGGSVKVYLRDLPEGVYTFTVSAFNARGEGPPAAASFTVEARGYWDPRLRQAVELLQSVLRSETSTPFRTPREFAALFDASHIQAVTAVFGETPNDAYGFYRPRTNTITISTRHRNARLEVLAAYMAHELLHVDQFADRTATHRREECFQDEIDAKRVEAAVWGTFGPPTPQTAAERGLRSLLRRAANGTLESWVREGYQDQCNRLAS